MPAAAPCWQPIRGTPLSPSESPSPTWPGVRRVGRVIAGSSSGATVRSRRLRLLSTGRDCQAGPAQASTLRRPADHGRHRAQQRRGDRLLPWRRGERRPRPIADRPLSPGRFEHCVIGCSRILDEVVGSVQVKTPDRSMDIMLNGWLAYQTLACRVWARSGFTRPAAPTVSATSCRTAWRWPLFARR